jgi:anti-anti-sigma factor
MAIRFDQYNTVGVVALDGDLRGEEEAAELRAVVGDALDAAAGQISSLVIDFTKARFVDGRGLEALLWSRRRIGDGIGAVRLAGLDADCRKIFEMTRLDDDFEVHDDVQAALRAMN